MQTTDNIISLTDTAIQHIKKIIAREKDNTGFRIAVKKSGCSGFAYVLDVVKTAPVTDITLQQRDITIFIAQDAVSYIKGMVVDFASQGMGQGTIVFNNPNVINACGCGESFSVQAQGN
jgi:iron-sulfur cluster assembly accessory protein